MANSAAGGASDYNTEIIKEFRANQGRVGGPWAGITLILIHHIGARSGIERVTPVAYHPQPGGRFAIWACAVPELARGRDLGFYARHSCSSASSTWPCPGSSRGWHSSLEATAPRMQRSWCSVGAVGDLRGRHPELTIKSLLL